MQFNVCQPDIVHQRKLNSVQETNNEFGQTPTHVSLFMCASGRNAVLHQRLMAKVHFVGGVFVTSCSFCHANLF